MTPDPVHPTLLQCVANSLGVLLEDLPVKERVNKVLASIGSAVKADRAYIFENHEVDAQLVCSQRYEWTREGISAEIDNPSLQEIPYATITAPIYEDVSAGRVFARPVRDVPQPLRASLEAQGILSLALVPLIFNGKFEGFVGFDDCVRERVWDRDELDLLRAVAAGLASSIARDKTEQSMKVRADELARSRRVALSLMEDAQRAVAAAEEANRAKSSFLAMMSHEIRTPLNGVIGFAELLSAEDLTDPQRELVSTIRSCGDALLSLISDILDLSRIEAGKLDLSLVTCRPLDCLRDVVKAFEPAARAKGLRLAWSVEGSMPETIITDPKRLRQILFNLIGNAVKFTPEGHVSVSLGLVAKQGCPVLTARVCDSGIGMTPEEQNSIFAPFAQANPAIHRKFGGSGLGLSICKSLIDAMGGGITVESLPSQGTTFTMELPVSLPGDERNAEPATPQHGPGAVPRMRVLVVDDVPTNRRLTVSLLRRMGLDADTAADGREAVDKLLAGTFDVALMDVLMPICDGIEATREIRAVESTEAEGNHLWIIALTADAFEDNRRRCLDAGMDDFLTKPVRMDALQGALTRVPRNRRIANDSVDK